MINIPEDILSVEELCDALGRKAKDIDIEITGISIEKKSLVLIIDTKLNFVMPRNLESVMKKRVRERIGSINRIRINYMYTGYEASHAASSEPEPSGSNGNYNGNKYRNSGKNSREEPAHENQAGELILMGKDFGGEPVAFDALPEMVGTPEKPVVRGEVFHIESMPIKNGKVLCTILIASGARTFCIKQFVSSEKFSEIEENLSSGDMILVKGAVEYDTFEHENVIKPSNIKKVKKEFKQDTYPNGRRVELHCHSKMSDNDGFNEVADIVNTAAQWGQPAVAITDHGVVQGFPDAAKAAGNLARKGIDIKIIYGLEGYLYPDEDAIAEDGSIDIKKNRTYHIIILARNQEGLKNIYKLVSLSHIDYFYKRPRIPRSVLQEYREGLIIGSACEAGELYQAILRGASDD